MRKHKTAVCGTARTVVWEVGKCENRRQMPFMISIYLLPDSFYSLCQRQSYPTLDDMIVVGVKNKMLKSKCCEIYEEVKSALGIVPSKAGKM